MKDLAKKVFLTGFFLCTMPSVVFASEAYETVLGGLNTSADVAGFEIEGNLTIINLIATAINLVLSLTGLIFLGLTVYSGINLMFANGDPKKIQKSKDILINAAIGIVLIISAYAITSFIFTDILPGITGETVSSSSASSASSGSIWDTIE
jgi:hypothetical protein